MADDEIERRKKLTFAEAEGLAPLPRQLGRTEVSAELRAVLWDLIHRRIQQSIRGDTWAYVGDPWAKILRQVHVYLDHKPTDEFSTQPADVLAAVKPVFMTGTHDRLYGWLQFVMQVADDRLLSRAVAAALEFCRAPYRVVDGYLLMPVASEQDAETVVRAFAELRDVGVHGAREHLKAAAARLNDGKFADSVRESINAVESVAKALEPSADLSKTLVRLEASANIHGALKKGFLAIYGYTSDQQGIRHPLIDDPTASVDETDALFMIGACSAFISYLIAKGRTARLFENSQAAHAR
jgi:hypothetical protein